MDTLTNFVTLLLALSIASERLVEIVKNAIPWLNKKSSNEKHEGWRKSILQALAVVAGMVTAYLAGPALGDTVAKVWQTPLGIVSLGLLASGGSGMWNTLLTYLLSVKNIKASQLKALEDAKSAEGGNA